MLRQRRVTDRIKLKGCAVPVMAHPRGQCAKNRDFGHVWTRPGMQVLSSVAPTDPALAVAIDQACSDDMAVASPGGRVLGLVSRIFFVRLIAYYRTTLVPHPIGEAEVIYPDIVIASVHRRGCRQRRSPTAFAMGDDMIAWAKSDALQHASQRRGGTNEAIVHQIGMRQMPGAREMPTATTVAGVLSSELCACAGVEHMRRAVKLTLEGLSIDQAYGP